MSELHKILTKALNEPAFAAKLKNSPADALKDVGVQATPEKLAALSESVNSLAKAHQVFGGQKPY